MGSSGPCQLRLVGPLGWSPGERGSAAAPEEGATITRCGCSRDCGAHEDPVCGSDGVVYANACRLQEASCRGRERLEPAPPGHCDLGEDPPAPGLGDATSPWNALPHLLHHTSSSITSSTLSGITLLFSALPTPSSPFPSPSFPFPFWSPPG